MKNDFDIELEKGNKATEEMTQDEAMSWKSEDDYNDIDFDFSNVQKLVKHPKLPTTLED